MIWFFTCVGILLAGYFIYGRIVERIFGVKADRQTPAVLMSDGVDYVSMPTWKIWLIQLLNIAGVGPIFGPILGALYGPVAMLWIVFGAIFAGAVHDYFSGMMSIRNGGASIPNMVGKYLGVIPKNFMNIFALVLLILVGVVFVMAPAGLLFNLTKEEFSWFKKEYWLYIIFIYYVLATLVPIDKIIGKIYPLFGALLLFMSIGMIFGLIFTGKEFYGATGGVDFFTNFSPKNLPIWPLLFITIACGAVSGFHATQSPLMARCLENEKNGRFVFYGAMIGEGIIALIWCTVGLSFYQSPAELQAAIDVGTASKVVYDSSIGMLGVVGGTLAVLGVVILPITSGDTAFRAARLIVAEFFNIDQKKIQKRLLISIPMFVLGYILTMVDFNIIWRYFGWANQTTAMVMLWAASGYLMKNGKFHWITTIPAMFMSAVCFTFLAYAEIGFGLSNEYSTYIGIGATVILTILFFTFIKKDEKEMELNG